MKCLFHSNKTMVLLGSSVLYFFLLPYTPIADDVDNTETYKAEAQKLADEKFRMPQVGEPVKIKTKSGTIIEGKYSGLDNDAVKIGLSKVYFIDLPNDLKYMFFEKENAKLKQEFINKYIKNKKVEQGGEVK